MAEEIAVVDSIGGGTPAKDSPAPASDKAAPVETEAEATTAKTPAADAGADEPSEAAEGEAPAPKKPGGVSKRISELTRDKYTLQRQVDQLMELARSGINAGKQPAPQAPTSAEPKSSDFASYDDFNTAKIRHEAMKIVSERDQAVQRRQQEASIAERREALKAKLNESDDRYPDFEDTIADVAVTPAMQEFLADSSDPRALAHWLGTNDAEAKRIAKLSPVAQIRELAKAEMKLEAAPIRKVASTAPAPVKTVSGSGGSNSSEPKSMAEFMKMRAAGWGS